MVRGRGTSLWTGCAAFAAAFASPACAQSIEPRAYSPGPVGVNFLVLALSDTDGGLSIDPSLPVSDAKLSVRTAAVAYVRTLDFWGNSGKVDVIVPYGKLSGSAIFQGEPVERKVDGFGDPLVRVSVSLYGAPALNMAEFRNYRQDLLVAASVQVSVPVGQYDGSRLLNIGANRWSVKPEIGVSKALGRWIVELAAAGTFYGDNDNFFGGRTRSQDAIYSAQTHVIYNLPSGIWLAANATYFAGGRTKVDGIPDRNLQSNWRAGVTAAMPLSRRMSVKINASSGVSARTGNNYDLLGVALQYRWGGGI
ncbi:hypothetical protein ACFB49_40980 [Sphingomonas sp. DBB INV C78]|uniref:transporter n=1 Tax=Sphingomonas sp. DBB INV C78 TaxID=3349434 RepID=UPI0036D3A27B